MVNGLGRREDSFLIGFVSEALTLGAITIDEAHQWVCNLIRKHDDLPTYIYDLTEASNCREFDEIISFPVYADTSRKEMKALLGISYLRGFTTEEDELDISKKTALKALKDNPQIEKRFRETFPFIDF